MTTKIGEKLITHYMNRSKHIKENNCSNFKFLSNILSSTLKISSRVKGPRSLSYYRLLASVHALTRVLRGSSIFWIKINDLDLLLFEFSTFFNHKKKNLGCNEIKKKKF